jgi:hypothetical protein
MFNDKEQHGSNIFTFKSLQKKSRWWKEEMEKSKNKPKIFKYPYLEV